MKNDPVLLRLEKINKVFPGVKALDDVNFAVREREVHALIGENGAGKSTLMKIILGIHQPTGGTMELRGKPYQPKVPMNALEQGISMIHQEISLVPTMSVSENVWIGREARFGNKMFVNKAKQEKATRDILAQLGLDIDPGIDVGKLSIAQMQLVEIARAVSYDSDIIIMDEPTSALTDAEVDRLYAIIRDLKARGKSVIFISHKLEEVLSVCDTITVLRDGKYIDTLETAEVNKEQLISLMVGREMSNIFPKEDVPIGDVLLEVRGYSQPGLFQNISFELHRGEILGFAGLIGAGRTEIMRAIFGVDPHQSGELYMRGQKIMNKNTKQAIDNQFSMVTEDRLRCGAMHALSIKMNASIAYLRDIIKLGFVRSKKESGDVIEMVKRLDVKMPGLETEIGKLSGGNQQKVIIAKWLLTEPEVLILDEPTRGIDVGAKAEIYKIMGALAKQGKAMILISSELPELMGVSDRIIVIREGQIVKEFQRGEFHQESIMASAFGIHDQAS